MASTIKGLVVSGGSDSYSTNGFRVVIEDHLKNLMVDPYTTTIPITDLEAQKYKGDFYGLLSELKIEHSMHWIILRLNGFSDPADYKGTVMNILFPDITTINGLLQRHETSRSQL